MKVIAAKGTRCPKEDNPREYITDSDAVDVPETVYYKRLIKDGSLTTVQTVQTAQTVETVSKKEGGKK